MIVCNNHLMTNNTTPQFSAEAIALWDLQNEATTARALTTMGEFVPPARATLRQQQAVDAQVKYAEAVNSADPDVMDEYAALLRWRHENGMR